jgi:hypothetical protein
MEGLDLPDATHLYQVEPTLREDKEKQAQARGQRLGGERKLEIVQLLVEGTIEEQQWNDLREIRGVAECKKRTQAVEFEGKQVKLLNALRLLRPDPVAEASDEEDSEGELELEVDAVEVEVKAEAAEEMEQEEVTVDDAVPTPDERSWDRSQSSGAGASSDPQPVSDHERAATRIVSRVLLDAEDDVSYEHVGHAFASGLRSWRSKVKKASTLIGVSALMVELRHGMLEDLFDADWKKGGQAYNRWIQSARSPDLSATALEGLVVELLSLYDADAVVSETPTRRESPVSGKRKRAPTVDLSPKTVKKEQCTSPTKQPGTSTMTQIVTPAWKKLAVQLLKNGKVSSAQIANAIKDMAAKNGETVNLYSLYEDELGLEAARINNVVVAMES